MATTKRSYHEEIIGGEPILLDLKTKKAPINSKQAKKIAATARHLIRINAKKNRLSLKEKELKVKLRRLAQEYQGLRGAIGPERNKKVLITFKEKKSWIKKRLKEWLGALYLSLVTEKEIIKITIISGKVSGDEIRLLLQEFFLKKGLNKEEVELVMENRTDIIPNERVLKKLAKRQKKDLKKFYDSKLAIEVAVKDI